MGRVGSVKEVFEYHGSGRVTLTRSDPRRSDLTREKPEKGIPLWRGGMRVAPNSFDLS